MQSLIDTFRKDGIPLAEGFQLDKVEDYLAGTVTYVENGQVSQLNYPKSNVLKYVFKDESWVCVRPSGTEPKLKLYFAVKGSSEEDVRRKLEALMEPLVKKVEEI